MQHLVRNSSTKSLLHLFIFASLFLALNGCTPDDPCKDVYCLNGGACDKGSCKCPPGYSGLHCETFNPCYNVTCLNGGICVGGNCNCPTGYTGSNCGIALPLKSVTITKIVVNNYPTSHTIGAGGIPWDPSSTSNRYPDIYININPGTSSIPVQSSAIYYDVNSVPQTYPITPVTLNNPSNDYSIGLYDDDFPSADEFMGGLYFKPTDHKAGYPNTIQISNSNARLDYTIYVIWNF